MTKLGKFITIEGGEATGKTTQIKKLKESFKNNGEFVFTREPGGTVFAEEIRKLLIEGDVNKVSVKTELLLINAARSDHIDNFIRPNLVQGTNVICDRFFDSTIAYQCDAAGVSRDIAIDLHKTINMNFAPDLTLFLDLDPNLAFKRRSKRIVSYDERFEKLPMSFHEAVWRSFKNPVLLENRKFVNIDAAKDIDLIHSEILFEINNIS